MAASIGWLAVTSLGIHFTEGAIFGIVPYINPAVSGQIAGLVGLGGNLGGIVFGFCFMHLSYQTTFGIMGAAALTSTVVYGAVFIPGQATLWTRETSLQAMNERVANEEAEEGDTKDSSDHKPLPNSLSSTQELALPTIPEV